jgi:hypothetical protein
MGKWLAAGGAALIALLVLIWVQMREPAQAAPVTSRPRASSPAEVARRSAAAAGLNVAAEKIIAAREASGKLDPASDEFTYHLDEVVPANLTAPAASCYTGGLHRVDRNARIKLGYKLQVHDGEVTVQNVRIVESTLNDPQLAACFRRKVASVHWHDDALPDWQQDDELVINPERGMKKFTQENMAYEGDGPVKVLKQNATTAYNSRGQSVD